MKDIISKETEMSETREGLLMRTRLVILPLVWLRLETSYVRFMSKIKSWEISCGEKPEREDQFMLGKVKFPANSSDREQVGLKGI